LKSLTLASEKWPLFAMRRFATKKGALRAWLEPTNGEAMPTFVLTDQTLALEAEPLPAGPENEGVRARRRAANWRHGLAKQFAYAAGRARGADEQARVWEAYEEELERGPDFARYHGDSEFREAPRITADRNALARIRVKLVAIANGSWATKEKGKHAGLVRRTTIAVFDALCSLAKKHGRVFPSHRGIAYLAKCSKNTVISALKQLQFFGFVTVRRRVKRLRTELGLRTVQDTNAYVVQEPNAWGEKALRLFTALPRPATESNKWEARNFNFLPKSAERAKPPLPGYPQGGCREAWERMETF
jgi:hypothetical protein